LKIDARVTASLIFAVLIETAGALLWAGRASARLDEMEARLEIQRPVAERLARLETQMSQAQASLDRIERRLDRK
jgi:type VI protein secretion system component VasK